MAEKLHDRTGRRQDCHLARQVRTVEAKWTFMARLGPEALTMLNFDRTKHLLTAEDLRNKSVLQIGIGSGGAPVNDHLTMNGVRQWMLFDPDTYDDVNLIKHPRRRTRLGAFKVLNQKEWIEDRNPEAIVEAFSEDVLTSKVFQDCVKRADLILCCADRHDVRLFVNSLAVETQKPCVTASVYRQGFGGEAYAYIPAVAGCFDCMS